ncbi:MAG: (d)CMP kinase [Oscillospiraceae bacterium]
MISIAIDGPAGAGKSTIAKQVAQDLGYIYVDTGAMYRAIGLYVYRLGKNTSDEKVVGECLPNINIEIKYTPEDGQRIFLCNEDVSQAIRQPEISMAASNVSAMSEVRKFLFELQRSTALKSNIIMDGRDIGTVVLPNAQIKLFLTADLVERAQRRYDELIEKGETVTYEYVLEDIRQRDYNDTNRAVAPLKQADDAILIDTTGSTLEDSTALVERIIKERLKNVL